MSFAAPGWLILGGLLGVAVILLHVRRREVVEVSSLELWRRLAVSQKSQTTLRPPKLSLLLFLQLLTVLLLTLALARPQVGAAPSAAHHVFLLDTSGSMNAPSENGTRLEAALQRLEAELTALPAAARVSLLGVSPSVDVVAARLEDKAEVLRLLKRLEPSDALASPSDWAAAVKLVSGVRQEEEALRLTVLTDGAGEALARTALATTFPDLTLHSFGEDANNAGLAEVRLSPLDLEEQRWQLEGTVRVFANEAQPLPLSVFFTPEGTGGALPWAEQELRPSGGRAAFNVELDLPAAGLLELRLPDDALASDNHRFFDLRTSARSARVLHVGLDNPPLMQALSAIEGLELFQTETLPLESDSYDLVILDRVAVDRHPGTSSLWLGGAALGERASSTLADPTPTDWNEAHPLASSVDWQGLELSTTFKTPHLPGATVLLEASGHPLIQARTTGAGREVVLAFDLSASPWTEELGFPVFIANLLRWAAPWHGQVTGPRCIVGQGCSLEPKALYQGVSLVSEEGEVFELPSPFVRPGPEASHESAWLPEGFDALFYPRRAGRYRLEPEGTWLTVDAPVGPESDLRQAAGGGAPTPATPPGFGWLPFRWLLLAALLVLFTETVLAGRGADRFLQGRSLQRGNPLARRHRLVLGVRGLTLLLVLLALLGLSVLQPQRDGRFVLIVDDSALYDEKSQARMADTENELARNLRGWHTALLRLGEGATGRAGMDLASALNLASGLLGEAGGRVALMTRNADLQGEGMRAISALATRGRPVDVVPVGGIPESEVFVDSLKLPAQLYQGDSFSLQASLYSSRELPARLLIWRNGELHDTQTVGLQQGFNSFETDLSEDEAGQVLYELELAVEEDGFIQNNRSGLMAFIQPRARVALVSAQTSWGAVLVEALGLQGLEVEMLEARELPFTPEDLLGYDAVLLANVPAIDLHSVQQETLETWVRDYGGGLIVMGGENSFGPGGYYQTALERISPLSSRVPQDAPRVAMMFVLDRSGSMQQQVGEVSRLDIAKEATVSAVELLHPESLTSVVVFDTEATTLLPLQRADPAAIREGLRPLEPGGGTALYWALISAYEQMRQSDAGTRHIVVMTDGLSQPADFDRLSQRVADEGITVSTVAIGENIDTKLLQRIARQGGGAFHSTNDFRALPSILSQEAMMLSSEPIERGAFTPAWLNREVAFLEGLPETLPTLYGYVQTTAKPEANLHLIGPDDMPLLASWRYGLGRVVTFASQGAGPWTRDWLEDPSYPLLWSQTVRWALPPVAGPGLHLTLRPVGDELALAVHAVDEAGNPATGLEATATLSTDDAPEDNHSQALIELEPGLYNATLPAEAPGQYQLHLEAEGFETLERSFHKAYPARYRFEQNAEGLQGLAAATGGRVIIGDSLLPGTAPLRWRPGPAWPLLVLLSLLLLITELSLRYAPGVWPGLRRVLRPARAQSPPYR